MKKLLKIVLSISMALMLFGCVPIDTLYDSSNNQLNMKCVPTSGTFVFSESVGEGSNLIFVKNSNDDDFWENFDFSASTGYGEDKKEPPNGLEVKLLNESETVVDAISAGTIKVGNVVFDAEYMKLSFNVFLDYSGLSEGKKIFL